MDPISNVDRIALLLRQKLAERARSKRASRTSRGTRAGRAAPADVRAVQMETDGASLRRALIQGILAEQFGEDLVNAAPFQQTIERVAAAIGEDAEASALLAQAVEALRSAS